ncbi:MAG: 3-isopropylmalate dehydratase large subunit [Clostridia bacterium]|nr:3-isopropylmalate dehydratase large subunit [Clostridia bacterium]
MGMTMSQKILAAHAGKESVKAGELLTASIDTVLGNDITTPVAVREFENAGLTSVFDKSKICIVLDHFVPNKDIKSAQQCKCCRTFANKFGIENFFDVGEMGIEHALLPEKGLVCAGELIIGADSHTCTYGALGAFSTGVGSTDMAYAMATGKTWFKVPSAIKVVLKNKPAKNVSGKDIILHLIGITGVDGALYKSLEFVGDGVKHLNMDERLTICNMAIEAGAKNGIFECDEVTERYMKDRCKRAPLRYKADADAEYERTVEIDLSALSPVVACPHLPSNVKAASGLSGIKIDQAVIGSCTNGRLTDMREAAKVFKGRHTAKGVRTIVIPATNEIYLDCVKEGLIEIFIRAGAVVSTPTCGPCLGGYMGILAENEKCIATTNRNFVGRMGHATSEIYLASPYVAACSAVNGFITDKAEGL